jgi:class 3 adenylate cyclase
MEGDRVGSTIDRWRRTGREALVVSESAIDQRPLHPASVAHPDEHREVRSIIFTDFSGFSKLEEQHLPVFLREVMGRMAAVLDLHAEEVLFRNTWGDALFAIVSDPAKAADVALSLTERLQEIDATVLGLDAGAGMRIGVHHGPVYRSLDPITGKPGYFGSEVTYTARLEPVTPVGKVYVTQPFAALLAFAADRRFRCQYVGPVALAKSFATLPMYRLSRS